MKGSPVRVRASASLDDAERTESPKWGFPKSDAERYRLKAGTSSP
jgi:hypothetical protein